MRSLTLRSRAGLLTALLLVAVNAYAADVRVTYDVEEKALKEAVSGTALLFTLYSDSTCTTVVSSQLVAVDDAVPLQKVASFKPKNGDKPAKIVRLHRVLSGVTPTSPLYLTVTGTGISPIGGACQVQAAGVAGPAGAVGPAGPPGAPGGSGPYPFMGRIDDFEYGDGSFFPDVYFASPSGPTATGRLDSDANNPSCTGVCDDRREMSMPSRGSNTVMSNLHIEAQSVPTVTLTFTMVAMDDVGVILATTGSCVIGPPSTRECTSTTPSGVVPPYAHVALRFTSGYMFGGGGPSVPVNTKLDFSWELTPQ